MDIDKWSKHSAVNIIKNKYNSREGKKNHINSSSSKQPL